MASIKQQYAVIAIDLPNPPDAVWRFAVSGYRVLPRWIEGRKGLPDDEADQLRFEFAQEIERLKLAA